MIAKRFGTIFRPQVEVKKLGFDHKRAKDSYIPENIFYRLAMNAKNEVAYLNVEDIARGLGFTQNKNGVEYVRWETINRYLADFGFPNILGK